jgi:hypothetical protein
VGAVAVAAGGVALGVGLGVSREAPLYEGNLSPGIQRFDP